MKPLLQLKKVTVSYPNSPEIIKNVSLELFSGQTYAVVGDNGSGKSTLLKAICGLLPIQSGSLIRDEHIKIGYVPEQCNPPGWLTVYKFLYYNAQLLGLQKKEIEKQIDILLNAVELTEYKNTKLASCSKGMSQRVCIAQALLGNPELLVLDEPFSGLDKNSCEIIEELCFKPQVNRAVIFSCHDLHLFQPNTRSVKAFENIPSGSNCLRTAINFVNLSPYKRKASLYVR